MRDNNLLLIRIICSIIIKNTKWHVFLKLHYEHKHK